MSKRHVAVWIVCALVIGLIGPAAPPAAAAERGARIQPGLLRKLDTGRVDRFVVEFGARADLAAAGKTRGWAARGNAVYGALTRTAARSQAHAKTVVDSTRGAEASSFWISNVLIVTDGATASLARRLASVEGVTRIRAEKTVPLVEPVEQHAVVIQADEPPPWGITKIGADDAWAEGVLGSGIVVGSVDTGVDYTHEALVHQYRGNLGGTFDHDYNWWDPTGICGDTPCDNAGHGTHTMGTIVGGDGPGPFTPDVGVAPGATWIAAKGCESFDCSEGALLSSGEFMLAPTDLNGANPDPSKRPDVVNNSWGGGPGDPFYLDIVQAWRAAGIVPVFSAGNSGPDCESGGSPGDFLESFSVGATTINDGIAEFSGRGPSSFGKVNPDVSAPGVNVISSVPGGGYEANSGTSMAAPHVSGAIALLLSAKLGLLGNVAGSTDAVRITAHDLADDSCGGDADGDPNNVFGDGRIDAAAAVDFVATGGTLAGDVSDVGTSDPVAGATIDAEGGGRTFSATTDEAGHFELFLAPATYTVTASAFGYQSALVPGVEIETDQTTTQDFLLDPLPLRDITGTVTSAEDGAPVEGAEVRALGTPVDPAITDASGDYTLTLPIGDYTIRVAAGGCTDSAEDEVTLTLAGLVHDAALSRTLDGFGHGCRPIALDWVHAANETALFGEETIGRLALPFSFPFYGDSYDEVFLTDNGFLAFEQPDFSDPVPSPIPSTFTPNAAIYPFWQNLVIDTSSAVRFETVGASPDRAFVLEFEQLKVGPRFGDLSGGAEPNATARLDFEVKLWEDGRIDILYGDNPANPGDGRNATIGIENADGTDALQFSSGEDRVGRNVAFRYEVVPNGFATGTVTDANDALPISGAEVTATPGGRTAKTDADGHYSLRLRPGTYELSASKPNYVTAVEPGVVVSNGSEVVVDASLDAPVAGVEPQEIDASVDRGGTITTPITITNSGSAALSWQLPEREGSRTPPDLPPVPLAFRKPGWAPAQLPAGVRSVRPAALPPAALEPVVDDPDDDSEGSVEVTGIRGGSDNVDLSLEIDFDPDTPMNDPVGYVFLDTDQDPSTGFPPEELAGLPEQDIGVDYFADLFFIHDPDPVVLIWGPDFELVATVPVVIDGQSVSFSVPLEALGNDDGVADIAAVIGDFFEPLDWVPDEGHGTVKGFTDVSWISSEPAAGIVAPGDSIEVDVTLGGEDLSPGDYTGTLFLLSDAPKQPLIPIELSLSVSRPEGWGSAAGTVWDAHLFEPIRGADVTVHTMWQGDPLDLTATSNSDGEWSVIGPPGTWDADATADGYLEGSFEVSIPANEALGEQDVFLHVDQPHATVRPGALRFTLLRGRQAEGVIHLGNVEGHEPLTFSVGEVTIPPPSQGGGGGEEPVGKPLALAAGADPNATNSRSAGHASPGMKGVTFQGDVLDQWETGMTLPWGVGFRSGPDTVTFTDPEDLLDAEFTPHGDRTGEFDTPWVGEWAADLAWDQGRGLLWHVNVGGDNAIYGIDPSDGSVVDVVEGPGWTDVSQRGLAYDAETDTFYIGGWTDGVMYHVAGPSWPTPGETLGSCDPDDPNISGLAYNPTFDLVWEATNSDFDDIWLIDPETCETQGGVPHPDPGFNGAGLELDALGNLWTVSQGSGTAYLIDSGLPTFSDVPWLSVSPSDGVVEPGDEATIDVVVDATGLAPGVHRAMVGIISDDPDAGVMTVPVRLLVTRYQRFVNVGDGPLSLGDGTHYLADRRFQEGRLGWFGPSSTVRATTHGISGTSHPAVFKSQREGMAGYRFTVPDGRYRIELEFAELMGVGEFGRVMDISAEGQLRVNNLDVAGQVGRWRALTTRFTVRVNDGVLTVRFAKAFGAPPILNGIRVTWLGT
jgi:subtilisin family serine protease